MKINLIFEAMIKQKSILYSLIMVFVMIGILLISPSVSSQTINLSKIIPNSVNIFYFLLIGILCFLWGSSSKYFR
jgi:hypothetical protein